MSRDQGFAVADTDTGLHTDPKVRLLWRLTRKASAMNAAMTLYEAVRLASWDAGERISAGDAAPFWFGDVYTPQQALTEAGLLDDEGCIPSHAWEGWFGPANERREQRREAGRIGGRTSRPPKRNGSDGEAALRQPSSEAEPVRTVPYRSDPSVPLRSVPTPAGAEKNGSKEPEDERSASTARAYAVLNSDASESMKQAARDQLSMLGLS